MPTFRDYEAIYTKLEDLLPKRGKGPIKQVLKLGKSVINASSVKKKIGKQRERVRDARDKFTVRYPQNHCPVLILNTVVGKELPAHDVGHEEHERYIREAPDGS